MSSKSNLDYAGEWLVYLILIALVIWLIAFVIWLVIAIRTCLLGLN